MATASEPETTILPQVTVQADVSSVVDEIRQGTILVEDIWVSCYSHGRPSVHGKAAVSLSNDAPTDLVFEGRDGVETKGVAGDRYLFQVSCPKLGVKDANVRLPRIIFGETKEQTIPKAIQSFDVAPNGSLFAYGLDNGSIAVSQTRSTTATTSTRTAKPHVSSVTALKFFPSNEVILTASMDMSLAVISVTDLSIPRKLKGHSRSVSDVAIVERGKNVISGARDGTVRLWDVGGGKQIRMMGVEDYSSVLKISVGDSSTPAGQEPVAPSVLEGEVGTQGKVLACALQSGRFTILDLGTKATTFTSPASAASGPLQSIAYSPDNHLLAVGSSKGLITVYDTRNLETPSYRCKRNDASVEDLAFAGSDLLAATVDGLPFRLAFGPEGPTVAEELVGYDCDPVRVIRNVEGKVWTAGDDGIVRCY